ncbi:MAG: hypothetical protein SVU32_03975 [Candidatus Nanohaloarchaea archaeon]|nr:hypothetical protein [Candidatus Nanohaloarchaea archaeon]
MSTEQADAGDGTAYYTVSRETYEEAFDEELPDSVGEELAVDRRGYASDVAEELGRDYLSGQALIFDTEQRQADLAEDRYRYLDQLLDQIYEDKTTEELITSVEGPIRFDTSVQVGEDAFKAALQPVETPSYRDLQQAAHLHQQLQRIDETDLQDATTCSTLLHQYSRTSIPDVIRESGLPETWAEASFSSLILQQDGTEVSVEEGQVSVEGESYTIDPIGDTEGVNQVEGWMIGKQVRAIINGRIDRPVYIKNIHAGINGVVTDPGRTAQPDDADPHTLLEHLLEPDEMRYKSRDMLAGTKNRLSAETSSERSLGRVSSVHEDVNLLVLADVEVNAHAGHGNITIDGDPPDDPAYRLTAQSTHGDVRVTYIDPELGQPLEHVAEGQQQLPGMVRRLSDSLHRLSP